MISVIIAVYNGERFLKETLESILYQTFEEWECIIVDDGSTDRSVEIIKEFIANKQKFYLIKQQNAGVCVARNRGVEVSKGDYLLFLDADDLLERNFFEISHDKLESNPQYHVVASLVKYFGYKSGVLDNRNKIQISDFLAENRIVVTSLMRREIFERIGGFDRDFSKGFEDWNLWLQVLKHNGKVLFTDETTFYYRIKKKSRNSSINSTNLLNLRKLIWEKNKTLYCNNFVSPYEMFEYRQISDSFEYKIGKLLLAPIRFFLKK